MKRLLSVILVPAFVLLAALQPVSAAAPDLYRGSVPVLDQSAPEQARAMPLALQQVLQKLTGLRDFGQFPELEPALQEARSMAVSFYFRNRETMLPDGEKSGELRFVAEFSRPAVDDLLTALQLPIWKPERKPLTVWLVVDDGLSRRIMPIEFQYAWEHMADIADSRGMPIVRPQPDSEGVYLVDPQLLWGGYTEDLDTSGPTDVLLIAARREGPEWNVRMNLDYMGKANSWRVRDIEIQNALAAGIETAIDEIAARNSIAAADQGHWSFAISITGLKTAGDYDRCLAYLQGLSLVDQVRVSSAAPGKVHFDLGLNAVPDYLLRALATDGVLAATQVKGEYALLP